MDINKTVARAVCEGANNSSVERLVVAAIRNRIERADLADWPPSRISEVLQSRYRTRSSPEGVVLLGVCAKKMSGLSTARV